MDAEHELVLRLFSRAATKVGSVAHLAQRLGISYADVAAYMRGKAIPPEPVLLLAVEVILDELTYFRANFPEAWKALSLPVDQLDS